MDREYSRQEELQKPWPFSILSQPLSSESYLKEDHPFYPLNNFKLRHHEPLAFPEGLFLSSNYFNPNWTGLRRVKNVVVIMEYVPSTRPEHLHLPTSEDTRISLSSQQEKHLSRAFSLLGFHAASANIMNALVKEDLSNALQSVLDEKPTEDLLNDIIKSFSGLAQDSTQVVTVDEFRNIMTSGYLQPKVIGRHWVALSLAEAETIRKILHVRTQRSVSKYGSKVAAFESRWNQESESQSEVCIALRYSPVSASHISALTGTLVKESTPCRLQHSALGGIIMGKKQ